MKYHNRGDGDKVLFVLCCLTASTVGVGLFLNSTGQLGELFITLCILSLVAAGYALLYFCTPVQDAVEKELELKESTACDDPHVELKRKLTRDHIAADVSRMSRPRRYRGLDPTRKK